MMSLASRLSQRATMAAGRHRSIIARLDRLTRFLLSLVPSDTASTKLHLNFHVEVFAYSARAEPLNHRYENARSCERPHLAHHTRVFVVEGELDHDVAGCFCVEIHARINL